MLPSAREDRASIFEHYSEGRASFSVDVGIPTWISPQRGDPEMSARRVRHDEGLRHPVDATRHTEARMRLMDTSQHLQPQEERDLIEDPRR